MFSSSNIHFAPPDFWLSSPIFETGGGGGAARPCQKKLVSTPDTRHYGAAPNTQEPASGAAELGVTVRWECSLSSQMVFDFPTVLCGRLDVGLNGTDHQVGLGLTP